MKFSLTRLTALLLVLLCAAGSVSAQETQCTLKLAELPNAPELLGLRMGMTTEQVRQLIPRISFGKVNGFGVSKTSVNPGFDPKNDNPALVGVRTISLDFLDGRTTSLWFGYDSSPNWKTVEDFVQQVAGSFHLPAAWKPWKTRGQQLSCADFQMTVSFIANGPSFHIIDTTAEQTLVSRREAEAERIEATENIPEESIVADRKTRVYYPASCLPTYEISESDRVVFKSKEEAENAGYKSGTQCRSRR